MRMLWLALRLHSIAWLRVAIAAIILACACAGCMKITIEVTVKKDGSGAVMQTVYYDKGLYDLSGILGDRRPRDLARVDKVREIARAQRMGEGVRLISTESVINDSGDEGTKTVFSFKDVRNLVLDVSPESLATELPSSLMKYAYAGNVEPMRFGFSRQNGTVLTVYMPRWKTGTRPDSWQVAKKRLGKSSAAAVLAMARRFILWVRIKVDGSISGMDGAYINDSQNGVTLAKIDFSKLATDADKAHRDALMDQLDNMEQAYKLCRNMDCMLVQKKDTLTIRYK